MDRNVRWIIVTAIVLSIAGRGIASESSSPSGQRKEPTKADAERMIRAAEGGLAPVYAPLAEEIVERLSLAEKEGVGIDLGSGPGTLTFELCRRTKLREGHGAGPKYDPNQTERQLREIVESLRVEGYRIHRPRRDNAEGINYGLWLEFRKAPL